MTEFQKRKQYEDSVTPGRKETEENPEKITIESSSHLWSGGGTKRQRAWRGPQNWSSHTEEGALPGSVGAAELACRAGSGVLGPESKF